MNVHDRDIDQKKNPIVMLSPIEIDETHAMLCNLSVIVIEIWKWLLACDLGQGSISISMMVHGTSFCFVCAHLTSGEKEGDEFRRNSDVTEILRRTRFSEPPKLILQASNPDNILDHE